MSVEEMSRLCRLFLQQWAEAISNEEWPLAGTHCGHARRNNTKVCVNPTSKVCD